MAKATTEKRTRAPQGAKRVAKAFFDELATIAETKQAEVAKAAQAIVRDAMIAQRGKAKAAKKRAADATPTKRKTATMAARETRGPTRGRKVTPGQPAGSSEPDPKNKADVAEES